MSLFNRNAPVTDSNIRILHAVPTANPIDIYANGNLIASNVSFGKLTKYSAYTIAFTGYHHHSWFKLHNISSYTTR